MEANEDSRRRGREDGIQFRFLCNRLPDEDTDQEELSWKSSCLVLSVAPGFMTPVSISRFKPLTCHEH
ncbi:hypothetical protein E3U43_021919 [Larimichthys crocea]|uniref:Uncharacterized protein n=1 Tax=Larimichthys crocea TaxID=215358 RepID=A0ACD3R7A1_LARCR|nr:hypothetical protein E3U43_021919 [Larimichthys crocea]